MTSSCVGSTGFIYPFSSALLNWHGTQVDCSRLVAVKSSYTMWVNPIINSLVPGKFAWNFRQVIFKQILVIDAWSISCEIALIWMSLDFTDDQSTLVQVMAWCRQAASHYLSQCWPRSLSPYGVTRPQRVNKSRHDTTKRKPYLECIVFEYCCIQLDDWYVHNEKATDGVFYLLKLIVGNRIVLYFTYSSSALCHYCG